MVGDRFGNENFFSLFTGGVVGVLSFIAISGFSGIPIANAESIGMFDE